MGGCESEGQKGFLGSERELVADLGRGWRGDESEECEDVAAEGIRFLCLVAFWVSE